jgi:hypothetical protein
VRPAFALLGFLLGSAVATTFSLTAVAIVFWILHDEYPRLDGEIAPLLRHLGLFSVLTVFAGLSFYAEAKRPPWRPLSLAGLAAILIAMLAVYWPR